MNPTKVANKKAPLYFSSRKLMRFKVLIVLLDIRVGVAEWLNAPVLKTGSHTSGS